MKLENYTTNEIINYLTLRIATDKGVSKALAKELVLNALSFNVVISAIDEQVDYLLANIDKEAKE